MNEGIRQTAVTGASSNWKSVSVECAEPNTDCWKNGGGSLEMLPPSSSSLETESLPPIIPLVSGDTPINPGVVSSGDATALLRWCVVRAAVLVGSPSSIDASEINDCLPGVPVKRIICV